jgi:deazaflavin-dependent oxidoreductase (nitroreductase family)
VIFYRGILARPLGGRFLLLTTRGRRTGRPRTCGLNYALDGPTVYVLSGYGPATDWYRNLRADPHVLVRIGSRSWPAIATTVTEPGERLRASALLRHSALEQGPPRVLRPLFARLGLDYDAEARSIEESAVGMPLVALAPDRP